MSDPSTAEHEGRSAPHPPAQRADGPVLGPLVVESRPLRRGAGEVQFGIDPGPGLILTGLTEPEAAWLLTLETGCSVRSAVDARGPGQGWGLDPRRVARLIELLTTHRLVHGHDPGAGHSRVRARVAVLGEGPLAARVRAQVRLCGAAQVDDGLGELTPDLAVLVAPDAVVGHDTSAWATSGIAHLPVLAGPTWASVGPLVGPPGAPCLRCLDLTRCDQDPVWPVLLAQIDGRRGWGALDPALTSAVCGVVGMVVQAQLSGTPVPVGVSWGIRSPSPQVVARRWTVHPRCRTPHGIADRSVH